MGNRRMAVAALLAGTFAVLGLAGCGSESTVDQASTPPSAAVGGTASADAAATQPANPDLPPPSLESDNDAVNAALVGLSEADAQTKAIAAGYTIRIASVDGEGRVMTMDYRSDRINLELEDGLVTRAYVG